MSCELIPQPPSGDIPPVFPAQSNRIGAEPASLADLTTMGVGGTISRYVEAHTREELIAAIREADSAGVPLLVLGGGSNILASDEPFEGVVVRDMRSGIETVMEDGCGGAQMRALAGTPWDDVVRYAIEHEWRGLEALSGIPGAVGAAPVQNIGAYGQELADTFAAATTYDRETGQIKTLFLTDMKFSYRDSILKQSIAQWGYSPRWIVLDVLFHMFRGSMSAPIKYGQLAGALGVEVGQTAPAWQVRETVLALRASKGMVLDDSDRDTFSCGSFFTNPILPAGVAATLPPEAPRYSAGEGLVKTSAAWLIDHAGFPKGFAVGERASLSTKHTLALTNRGGATSADIRQLARHIQEGVRAAYGVDLHPEPVVLGETL
ncbi:UDP-N-acetylmuramate dehydrogenase [Arcanobacterium wilhelmae]|uniref:UDP-N-acetylenolpyruvoylglucosamine reductase n=1 Tax=Arcanobacterium wilhelmae TaxID=1803177 RepID=A0ABT9NCC1_9ACTO|nr:UDP-N-acetylmuramate dehydrogenase [Arcanobacterium wilhelmae]MDP9801365.1 UDP-N-acetylmuramate dehydrogenase [Arcanobacterium wilhelmae]WFN90701.1 UDP-N-acetylmuramate dehydrogenase [Arcanobacterium wilhelmae]